MSTVKINYAASATILCTLAALASSSTVGRGATIIDNGTNLYDDVILYLGIKNSGTTLGASQAIYVYIFGSEDGVANTGDSKEAVGSDAAVTISNPTNLLGPIVATATGGGTSKFMANIAQFFGGRVPRKWGFVVLNGTKQNLDPTESNHQKTYTGITYTVV